jgi:hypothetical protein
MKIKEYITFFVFALFLTVNFFKTALYACDLDNDGLAEIITYNRTPQWNWNIVYSSDNTSETLFTPGSITSLPAPGHYYGGTQDYLGVVNFNDGNWNVSNLDNIIEKVNFFFPDARSYIAGQDFNGDGVSDLAKFIGGCSKVTSACYNRTSIFAHFLLNSTNGTNTFVSSGISTATGVYGRGLSALVTFDVNEDGRDDICYTLPRIKRNPRQFRLICKDVQTGTRIKRAAIGKLYASPLSIEITGRDYLVLWRRTRQSVRLSLINFSENITIKDTPEIVMDRRTTPIVAKWNAGNTEQIGFVVGGNKLHIYNPLTQAITIRDLPEGTPISCKNNFKSITNSRILTTRNACRAFDCNAS